jgi:drug/metabolite transporter (DMT)-like permease
MKTPGALPRSGHDLLGYVFAFCAAAAYGTAAPLIKIGLTRYGSVLTGMAISLAVGLLALTPLAIAAWRGQGAGWRPERRAILFVLASGCCAFIGFGSNTFALSKLPVVVVSPISSTYPLVTVLLVRIFLRHTEAITRRTALGAALIVCGVICVTLSQRSR